MSVMSNTELTTSAIWQLACLGPGVATTASRRKLLDATTCTINGVCVVEVQFIASIPSRMPYNVPVAFEELLEPHTLVPWRPFVPSKKVGPRVAISGSYRLKKGFIVGGDSAGGNMSAAIPLKARDDPFFAGRPLTGQYLLKPAVAYPGAHPEKYKSAIRSSDEFSNTPFLNKESALRFSSACLVYPLFPID